MHTKSSIGLYICDNTQPSPSSWVRKTALPYPLVVRVCKLEGPSPFRLWGSLDNAGISNIVALVAFRKNAAINRPTNSPTVWVLLNPPAYPIEPNVSGCLEYRVLTFVPTVYGVQNCFVNSKISRFVFHVIIRVCACALLWWNKPINRIETVQNPFVVLVPRSQVWNIICRLLEFWNFAFYGV